MAGAHSTGVGDFAFVFFGGAVVGWGLAVVTRYVLGRVEGDPLIEISLTTFLAYFSFLFADHGCMSVESWQRWRLP